MCNNDCVGRCAAVNYFISTGPSPAHSGEMNTCMPDSTFSQMEDSFLQFEWTC